ncbi:MAG: T9SS type A sorting domain-containing protein [Bacteroidales bacterium]|nr:T9SS type A sorting domain-containing protein [Bacteroidales bacterium]
MKKVFLSFVVALLCGIVSFAQTPIYTAEEFRNIQSDGNYILANDINLGDLGERTAAIISSFSGTFDGDEYTISYQANFQGNEEKGKYGLFGDVSGTIINLKVSASITLSGVKKDMNVGLLCGYVQDEGIIKFCDVSGNINSTVSSENGGGTDAGLVAGQCLGSILYCNAIGNVSGIGYVGGVVGALGDVWEGYPYGPVNPGGTVIGCSFVGAVTANDPNDSSGNRNGSFGGGICGMADNNATINLCYVNASITSGKEYNGVTSTYVERRIMGGYVTQPSGYPDVTNSYAEGTVNEYEINADSVITNSSGTVSGNYHPGSEESLEQIVAALNTAAAQENPRQVWWGIVNGEFVFSNRGPIEQETGICETPTNLAITQNADGTYTASWNVEAMDGDAPNTFKYILSGGNLGDGEEQPVNGTTLSLNLEASSNPYTLFVWSACTGEQYSEATSTSIVVACPVPAGLVASNITDEGFTVSWDSSVDCQVSMNGTEETIASNQEMRKSFAGLNPETQYTVFVKAKCGNDFVEQASINVTTACLSAPTGLKVTPTWEETSGKIVVEWDMLPGLTYEIDGESGDKVTEFVKTGLGVGSYTLKLRAKKGEKTSEWVSMPYTISNPEAPKIPIVNYDQTGETFTVSIDWTKGVETATAWKVGENEIAKPYVLTEQEPGSVFEVAINEISPAGTSAALVVPVLVPCLPATAPTAVATTQTSVTMTWETANSNRKVIIGSTEYAAGETTLTIDGLEKETAYSYQVREYCNSETYSSEDGTFATAGCFAVSNLTSIVGVTTATISWTSQSPVSGLRCLLEFGDEAIETTETSYTFTNLDPSTPYFVYVYEECGNGWENGRLIEFTTLSSDFETEKSGLFNETSTWKGGRVPAGNIGTITINQGHEVTLANTLTLSGNCQVVNNGILKIIQQGQLVNTTDNNVGGIVEVETDQKTMNAWTFVGAPFAGYALEAVKPVSGSDVAMVKYNYTNGNWSDSWATIATTMEAAEGTFAWTFYEGAITFTTYGDVENAQYDYEQGPKYVLNNGDVPVSKPIVTSEGGNWMALSNPYPAKLSVSKFLGDNTLQGNCVYVFRNGTFDMDAGTNGTQGLSSGNIEMTEGFFVNFGSAGSHTANFNKEQLTNYPSSSSKSSVVSSEFIELTLQNGKDKVRVYFAHNEDAEQGYDILDANKMFATTGVAEPYFVTDGIALIKEEVRDLPYYATMNVRSQQDTVMNFVLTNLPEGLAVSIIDGEEVIDMVEGGVYSTEILTGENADRFKVLVKKNVGLADVEELDVRITNSNRHIAITAQENVKVSVYNTLGQKVFETEETNFVLSGVVSGAYVVKVQGAKASKSQKIIVE